MRDANVLIFCMFNVNTLISNDIAYNDADGGKNKEKEEMGKQ